jgi:hypothetical protein
MTSEPLKPCPRCKEQILPQDAFCQACGYQVSPAIPVEPLDQPAPSLKTEPLPDLPLTQKHAIRKAAKWIFALGVLFLIFGTGFGIKTYIDAEKVKTNLKGIVDDQLLSVPINGKHYTAGELRLQVTREVWTIFITNYLLATIMFGLYFWARSAPFPAMVTALCVYLAVIVLNAIFDPATIVQGILVKVLFFAALIAGLKAALVARSISANPR